MTPNRFDGVAQDWDKNLIHTQRTEAIKKAMLPILQQGNYQTALEFGAGTGLLSFALKDEFQSITMMDNSQEMVKVSNEKIAVSGITNIFPLYFDLEHQNYEGKTFDCIFTQMAMHHVENINIVVQKFSEMLKPNGLLAIADLYLEDGTFHDDSFTGHKGFDPEDFKTKLAKVGFVNINYSECFVIQRENGNYPIFLMKAEKS